MSNYHDIPLSNRLDDAIEEGVKQAIKKKKLNKQGQIKKVGLGLAAGLMITLGLGFTNPALASKMPILGHIFEQVEKTVNKYAMYSKYAKEINQSVTSNGLTVTLSEITSDGVAVYVSYIIESEKPFEHGDQVGHQMWLYPSSMSPFLNLDGGLSPLNGAYTDEYTFIGMTSYRLKDEIECLPEEFDFTITFDLIEQINLYEEVYEGGVEPRVLLEPEYERFEGEWSFSALVTVDESIVKHVNISDVLKTRISIEEVVITPFETKITIDYGNMDPFAFDTLFLDENGDSINGILPAEFPSERKVTYHLPSLGDVMDKVRVLVYRVSVQDQKNEWRGTDYMEYTDSEVWFDTLVSVK